MIHVHASGGAVTLDVTTPDGSGDTALLLMETEADALAHALREATGH